jgi:DUF4097 and DUF4098 domain-containing protein YvlB
MTLRSKIVFIGLFILCAVLSFPHEEVKSLTMSADGIDTLMIDCGAGFLDIKGEKAQDRIDVSAEIILKGKNENRAQEFIRKNVKLELTQRGNRAILISDIKQKFSLFSWKTAVINLTVHIPRTVNLKVDDGSGWIKVENTAGQVHIDDGSGEIGVANITGNVEIDDGSGDIELLNIRGDVIIDDGSGSVVVEEASGDVEIDDGSGTVRIRSVGGNVTVSDSSGSIYIEEVGGDFVLKDDGSGSLHIKDVKGRVIK